MNFTKLAILTVLSIMNVAHASFNVSYPSIPVKVVSKDGLPLNNVSISYSVLAEKTQICRSDSIFDFGHPCLGSYILEETVGSAITNANGETRIPALNVSSLVSTGANPKLIINVSGNVVPFSVNPGKIMTCITSIPLGLVLVDNYPENKYVDTLSLDSETAKKICGKINCLQNILR